MRAFQQLDGAGATYMTTAITKPGARKDEIAAALEKSNCSMYPHDQSTVRGHSREDDNNDRMKRIALSGHKAGAPSPDKGGDGDQKM